MNAVNKREYPLHFQRIYKHYWIAIFVLVLLMIVFLALTIYFQFDNNDVLRTVFKTITSLCFLIIGLLGLLITEKGKLKFSVIFYIALVFAFLGDILITQSFIVGMAMFAITQIFLIVAYYLVRKISYLEWIIFGLFIIFDLCLLLLYKDFDFSSSVLKVAVIIYALLISFMISKSLDLIKIWKHNKLKICLIIIGALLFFASDFILLFSEFDINITNDPNSINANVVSAFNLISYYIGLAFLSISLKFPIFKS